MISIIIPNFNGELFLSDCLDSIYSQDFSDFEVILVDNGSTDQSIPLVRHRYPSVIIVENRINRGYAGGGNDGISSSSGDYLLFLNTDTILSPGFLSIIYLTVIKKPEYGMYAPKILYPDGSLQAAGCNASLSGSSWERGKNENDPDYINNPGEVFSPYGAAALFSRELIEKTGGFDEDFFLFVEETDLSFRARLAGYRCWYEPKAVVYHFHGGTVGKTSDIALYYLHRNALWYVFKNYPPSLLFFAFPFIIGRNILSIVYYLSCGRGHIILKAKIDAIRGFPEIFHKRKMIYRTEHRIRYNLCLSKIFPSIHSNDDMIRNNGENSELN